MSQIIIENFDTQFQSVKHYELHPQMKPYVGSKYSHKRLLIISESHFVPEDCNMLISPEDWYSKGVEHFCKGVKGNTNTSEIFKINEHRLFVNLKSALEDCNITMEEIAWYNFFQRPAQFGTTIKKDLSEYDMVKAKEVFTEVTLELQPKFIMFISTLAFDTLKSGNDKRIWSKELDAHCFNNLPFPIGVAPHPNSKWWNMVTKKYEHPVIKASRTGRQKFKDIIQKHFDKK